MTTGNSSSDSSSQEAVPGPGPGAADGRGILADDPDIWRVSNFRVALSQVLATSAQSLLLLSLGMMVGMPTIVIGALFNAKEGLSMNATQASWFAGILLACQPVGSVLSGVLSDAFGRRRCMMLVAVPQLTGWLLLYSSQSLPTLYLAGVVLGFSIGFMEAPGLSYVGEITQPHLRTSLCSLTSLTIPVGYLIMYLFGTMMDWRSTAVCSAVVPVITVLAISQLPESPMWLLKKGRAQEAEAALCWLRGWVSPAEVRREFSAMKAYSDKHQRAATRSPRKGQIYIEVPKNGNGPRLEEGKPPIASLSFGEKLKDLTRPQMLRPLRLVVLYFFFYHCAGLSGLRPYMVSVFKELGTNVDPYWLTVASALLQVGGALVCILTIHRAGKRLISLVSMSVSALSLLALGGYALLTTRGLLPSTPPLPLGLFATLFFFTNVGMSAVPWALISEVFPPRGRGIGSGVCSALYYLMYFGVSKTFLDLEGLIQLHGVFFLYGTLGLLGVVFVYCCLPETEGRNLEEIEKFFQDKTDRVVPVN